MSGDAAARSYSFPFTGFAKSEPHSALLVHYIIPVFRAMRAGLAEAAAGEFAAYEEIEIAMRHECDRTIHAGARHKNIGGFLRAGARGFRVFDLGMIARMPQ